MPSILYLGLSISQRLRKFMAFTSSSTLVQETPRLSRQSRLLGLYLRQLVKQGMDFWSWSFYWRILPRMRQDYPSCMFFSRWASSASTASLLLPALMRSRANFLGKATSL